VATQKGGIAREFDEITDDYIKKNLDNALANGKIVVAEVNGQLVGSLHGYKPEPKVFHHVLSDLTIAVHPDFQGKSIGKQLFSSFLTSVKNTLSSIARVELFVRESNTRAINLYKSLGFVQEGKLAKRIKAVNGTLEADIQMAWFNPNYHDLPASKL
jgi:putative acetyltransferase